MAITLGIATLIWYFFWSRQQKAERRRQAEQRLRHEEEQHRQAEQRLRHEEEQRKQAEEQRKQAIALARQREDLYEYDPSIQAFHKRSTENIFENPEDWAGSIQRRYMIAQKCLQDAELVLNDDVQKFNEYRDHLQTELVSKYEDAIRPYFSELSRRDKDIPIPRELRVAIDFVYPSDLQPSAIHGKLIGVSERFAQGVQNSLANSLRNKDLMKLQQGDIRTIAVSIAIAAAISGILYLFTASQQRTKLEKLQADVDLICEQISGAIKTYGKAAQEIQNTRLIHKVAVDYTMRHLDTVIQLSSQGKQFSELHAEEQKAVEICYRGGESLKKILQQELIQSIK
jgi:hypothetical protein